MTDYMAPEVIEIGAAEVLILGAKLMPDIDDMGEVNMPDGTLDE